MTEAPAPAAIEPAPLHNLEAEQSVLGALLYQNELLERMGALRAEHFHDPVHQRLFAKLRTEIASGHYVDAMSLKGWAGSAEAAMADVGGTGYLGTLIRVGSLMDSQALAYADMVRALAQRREIAAAAMEADLAIHDPTRPADDIIVEIERRLADIADAHAPFGLWRGIGEVMDRSIVRARQGEARGISTGLDALDDLTGGLTPGSLWVIAGAASMGKSLVGQAIALDVARRGHGVGYVHLEMGELSVGLRAATALAHDPENRSPFLTDGNPTYLGARRQKLSDWAWDSLRRAADGARALPLKIDARPHQTLSQIEAGAKRLQRLMERAGTPLAALFIDHEGLIAAEKDRKSKWEEVSDRTVRLQGLAKKLDVALVALVQINREGARKDGSERPNMGHLANSADIERCADVICLLYREAYFAQRKPDHECGDDDIAKRRSNRLEIIVDKSRDGERRTVKAILDVRTGYIAEAAN